MSLHRVPLGEDLPTGGLRRLVVAGRAVCVVRTDDGRLFAIDDQCSHEEESLSEGQLLGCEIECPWHFGRFDVTTGKAAALPAMEPIRTYPVSADGDDLLVDVPEE
ncbi:non-heme iron oxygenase ferredoxin subunit [Saccharopolyspora hattusasensis]|uniref:non-heme iron oxygenase ferredoxin subunit n=1 Tax=Saccharopolyspora hattusasensis TaxID=1128679 RepID=UPI003D9548DC